MSNEINWTQDATEIRKIKSHETDLYVWIVNHYVRGKHPVCVGVFDKESDAKDAADIWTGKGGG